MNRFLTLVRLSGILALLAHCAPRASAQWLTQTFDLKAGWNAVFLHVDASHATLSELVDSDAANPVEEVWLWKPATSTLQFIDSPQVPTGGGTQWASWQRSLGPSSELQRLIGNAAYLVRVRAGVAPYAWQVKGKPVPFRYQWTGSGLNFLGFPTPASAPPTFDAFLSKNAELLRDAEVYQYVGGEFGPGNPTRLYAFRTTPLRRGEAVWMRAGETFNRYFGPFEADLQNRAGAHFGEALGQYRIRLRNQTQADLTVTLALLPSEGAPPAQPVIAGTPPILLRGALNLTNLTYGHTNLAAGPQSWTLGPQGQSGAELEVVIGVDRSQMPGAPGDSYAGLLRFTDSLGLSQVDLPVSAVVPSRAGLWLGQASVNQVRHYLKQYQRDAGGAPVVTVTGEYQTLSVVTNLGAVQRPFPLRLILHNDEVEGEAVLLQRVYHGLRNETELVVATQEHLLDAGRLASARRVTAAHLPWSAGNTPWPCLGELKEGTNLTALVTVDYDDPASNPFLHTYHPDHDNLAAGFDQKLPQGAESFTVRRAITLAFTPPAEDFTSLTSAGDTLTGIYQETVALLGQGSEIRQFDVEGVFALTRISEIGTLTTP